MMQILSYKDDSQTHYFIKEEDDRPIYNDVMDAFDKAPVGSNYLHELAEYAFGHCVAISQDEHEFCEKFARTRGDSCHV